MREIKAIIQPFLLSKVINALKECEELPGVTVSEVKGFGKARAQDGIERVVEDGIDYSKKVKLEIVVPERLVEEVLEIIRAHAHTGRPGDGKIFVYGVDEAVKIRTGERGEAAI
ncbi:MAG: P-II family nitrogen regulator [Bacillota bacterium]|jgi:nitrogen regulatory protein P-II 1